MKKAAHFLLVKELAHSPPNDAIVSALRELNMEVDLFAPGMTDEDVHYGKGVRGRSAEYGVKWLARNLFSRRWMEYSVFSGTCEDPMVVVGMLGQVYRRPTFCLADEIRAGAYRGNAREYWKKLARFGMRRAGFNIVNDEARVDLQREYAGISARRPIIVYPGSFREPPAPGDRDRLRSLWGVQRDSIVISHSGHFYMTGGADALLQAVMDDEQLFALIQPVSLDEMTAFLLANLRCSDRIYVEPGRLSWHEAWASMAGVDIGLVMYRNPAPQFQRMGTSSNKLCMYLSMGVPVIALRQDSFKFIEEYECGVLVEDGAPLAPAIDIIRNRQEEMRKNALVCAKEYIAPQRKYITLAESIANLIQ